jgi:hypothetical protein
VTASLESAIAAYGRAAKAKLSAVAVRGEPEDQLRSPVERLLADLSELCGLDRSELVVVGESSLAEIKTRPDFAVSYRNVLAGFVELKAPGKGADPRSYRTAHDREQWQKLQALPNLIYSDGGSFSLWRDGAIAGSVVHLDGDIATSGSALRAPDRLLNLFHDFFTWSPSPPTTAQQLAAVSARLCRLLRSEVAEQLERGDEVLTQLFAEWRSLLFPDADHNQFADGYAQAVTFGLLLARAQGIGMENGVGPVAAQLAASRSLIGTALRILTDPVVAGGTLATSVATMARMLSSVDWPTISKGEPDVWLYFYEDFLAEYDSQLRRRTGSYYTPVPVVELMARLVDEALRTQFDLPEGLGNDAVTLVDPAMGTGTFLLEVVRAIGAGIAADQGEGAVAAGVEAALRRLIGFEIQVGPFAAMRGYQVSGVNVLDKWFSYRRRTRVRPVLGGRRVSALNSIQLDHWSNEYTTDLINLLHVLGLLVELEPEQADLLAEIVSGPLVTVDGLTAAGVLPVAPDARRVTRTPEATRDPDALW